MLLELEPLCFIVFKIVLVGIIFIDSTSSPHSVILFILLEFYNVVKHAITLGTFLKEKKISNSKLGCIVMRGLGKIVHGL